MTYESLVNSIESELRSLNAVELTSSRIQYWLTQFLVSARGQAYQQGYDDAMELVQRAEGSRLHIVDGDFHPGEFAMKADVL